MENVWHYLGLYLSLELADLCSGFPLSPTSGPAPDAAWTSVSQLVSVVLLASSVLLVFGCLCCRRTKGFQEFTDSGSTPNLSTPGGGYVNNATSTEFPLFPPPQPINQAIRFEPLPEIVPPNRTKKPAAFNNAVSHGLSEQDWFAEGPGVDFPRQQLQYVREAGRGWFGRVVEGNAQHIVSTTATTPVVVKILRADASPTDQMYFLHEVRAYRDLHHPNVLRMLGRCLEADPFLVLLEACPTGDLKSFLCQNKSTARALCDEGVTLNMACNIAAGLEHMLDNGFVHTDLAARNCLVTPDLTVKIGDYGHGIETFKEDYYIAGDIALPVRWCAPETVYCTDTTIQTKEVTPAANVWNLGVVLWEIAEFGKLPYEELTDDEVVGQVFGESKKRLQPPSLPAPHRDNLYLLMKLCWSSVEDRPALKQVHSMLKHLNSSRQRHQLDGQESSLRTEDDFNRRWETFKPNTIPKRDDHTLEPTADVLPHSAEPDIVLDVSRPTNIPSSETRAPVGGNQNAIRSPLHLALDDHNNQLTSQGTFHGNQDGSDRITPATTSPQLSVASSFGGEFFSNTIEAKDRSASLQNLRGSLDDLSDHVGVWDEGKKKVDSRGKRDASQVVEREEPNFDSWLKGVETTDEEDAKFVAKISEAIRDLDEALAQEKTSSSSSETSSKQHTPVKEVRPPQQNAVLDFRLGRLEAKRDRDESSEESPRHSGSSDTEDETWRGRVERGEFTQKVKEKSKSVADLMVLTHIDPSDNSDSEPPSLTWSFERGSIRTSRNSNYGSFSRPVRDANRNATALVSNSFGSEGDVHKAVLGEEFLESLQKIQIARRDSNKNILSEVANFLEHEKMHVGQTGIDFLPTNHNRETNFLVFDASGKKPTVLDTVAMQERDEPIKSDSIAGKELVGKVVSASVDEICRNNDSAEKFDVSVEIDDQVPDSQSDSSIVLEISNSQNKEVQDSKPAVGNSESLSFHSTACLADDVVENISISSGREAKNVPVVPEIKVEAPSFEQREPPEMEMVAKKPVPLPRRTLRLVCRDSSEDSDTSLPDVGTFVHPEKQSESSVDLDTPFITSTPRTPKAAPRLGIATDVSKMTDIDTSMVGSSVVTNLPSGDAPVSSGSLQSEDSYCLEVGEALLDSLESSKSFNGEVSIATPGGDDSSCIPTNTSLLSEQKSNTKREFSKPSDLTSNTLDPSCNIKVPLVGELSKHKVIENDVYQSSGTSPNLLQECDSLSSTRPSFGMTADHSTHKVATMLTDINVEGMIFKNDSDSSREPWKCHEELICSSSPQQSKSTKSLALKSCVEPDRHEVKTTTGSEHDSVPQALTGKTRCSNASSESTSIVVNVPKPNKRNLVDSNASRPKLSNGIDSAPCKVDIGNNLQTAVEKSVSVTTDGGEITREVESSVILGPCEDFTLEYFKGLKTTFPDSGAQAVFTPNFCLGYQSDETKAVPREQGVENGKSTSNANNIDFSINGWDAFLGKTLETQDVSEFDDVTFPSLVPEHSLLPTAIKVESVFMPDFDLKDEETLEFLSTVPSEMACKSSEAEDGIPGKRIEAVNLAVCGLKGSSDIPPHPKDGIQSCLEKEPHVDQLTGNALPGNLSASDNTLISRAKEETPLAANSLEIPDKQPCLKRDDFGELSKILDVETSEFSIPGFHLNVLEVSDNLREIEEHDVLAEFALDVKHCTPDDERSSDSGFRDKGSLSESCEDACDEKYNLEDIEAELEETFNQGGFNYKMEDEEERFASPEFSSDTGAEPEPESPRVTRKELDFQSTRVMSTSPVSLNNSQGLIQAGDSALPALITSVPTLETLGQHEEGFVASVIIQSPVVKSPSQEKSDKCVELEEQKVVKSDILRSNGEVYGDNKFEDLPPLYNEEISEHCFGEKIEEKCNGFEAKGITANVTPTQTMESEAPNPKKGGWYLHPPAPTTPENCLTDPLEDIMSPKSESSTSSLASKHDDSENSYVSYQLDEEYVTAIRNELREKLPCANQALDSDSEEDIIDEEETGAERQDIMIHYNMYPAPLSPILEERESMSSIDYSPYVNSFNFDSEPESLVFSLDSQEEIQKEIDAKKFEDDIREALENCSYESSSSSDKDPNTTVLLEDLDNDGKHKVLKVRGTSAEVEDDVLIVDTETNVARLVESPIPKLQLAFVNKRSIDQPPVVRTPDFLRDGESIGVNSGTFTISKNRFNDSLEGSSGTSSSGKNSLESGDSESATQAEAHAVLLKLDVLPVDRGDVVLDLNLEHLREKSDGDSYTPDSISPTTASAGTIPTTDTDDASEFYLTPSDFSPVNHPTPVPISCFNALQVSTCEPTFDQVKDISLNFPNNEAAEIMSDLEDCGIISSSKPPKKDVLQLMTGEIYEYQDSTESSDEKYSPRSLEDDFEEMISFEDYSQSSESREYGAPTPESQMSLEFALSKPDFTRDLSPVQRLDFLTSSIGIVSESNEDYITNEDFEDELDRTLKLNDLDSILKINTNALRGNKSMPSPNINSSAKEIIVNFVKSKEQNRTLLDQDVPKDEGNSTLTDLETTHFKGDLLSESLINYTFNYEDRSGFSNATNRNNDSSNMSLNSDSNLEPEEICLDQVSQVSIDNLKLEQDGEKPTETSETTKKSMGTDMHIETIIGNEGIRTDSDVQEIDLNSSVVTKTIGKDSNESDTNRDSKTYSNPLNNDQLIASSEEDSKGSDEEEEEKKVGTNNVVASLGQSSVADSDEESTVTCSIDPEASKHINENGCSDTLVPPSMKAGVDHADIEDCNVQNLASQIVFLENSKQNNDSSEVVTQCATVAEISGVSKQVADPDDITIELENLESGLEDWSQFREATRAPMPSPEEESWRKLSSSMLSFSGAPTGSGQKVFDLSSSMLGFSPDISPDRDASNGDKGSPLGEVTFDRDLQPASMLGFSDEKVSKLSELSFVGPGYEDGEMSTSFSAPGEEEEEEEDYAPDWESDSEGSSSSGEFIWREGEREAPARDLPPQAHTNTRYLPKPYECLPEFPMEVIEEEEEDEEDDDDDDEDSSLGSGTEFVPSAWDSQATPSRSALRSPDKKTDGKKNVWFKKQKYHCVYEYPRENSDTENEACEASFADSHPWRPHAGTSPVDNRNQPWRLQTVNTSKEAPAQVPPSWQPPAVDYAAYADWEVTDGDDLEQDTDTESENQVPQPKAEPFDFYKLSNVDYDFSTGVISEDGEFFISSSARPFQQFNATPSNLFNHGSSQFFPGQSALDQTQASVDSSEQVETFAPDRDSFADEIDTSPRNIAGSKLGSIVQDPSLSRNVSSDESVEVNAQPCEVLSGKNRDMGGLSENIYLVNAEKNDVMMDEQNGNLSTMVLSLNNIAEKEAKNNGSDREYSDGGPTPPSPLSPPCGITPPSPTGLGELRHTRDRLKLNLPSSNAAFLLDVPSKWGRGLEGVDDTNTPFLLDAPGKRGRTLVERGEASLLDSGEETEDSGIESSNGMSATLTLKTTLEENINNALAHVH